MKKLVAFFLVFLFFQSCDNWFDILPEEFAQTIAPEPLELRMGVEITRLRIDLIRMVKNEESIETDSQGTSQSSVVDEDYHHIGFFLDGFIFFDLNDNLSLSVLSLFNIQPDEDYEIEHRIHGVLIDKVETITREGKVTTGKVSGLFTTRLFVAKQLDDGIEMDHLDLFPFRTYYIRDDKISERVKGLFVDLSFIRIKKNDNKFIAPSALPDKTYSQPEPDKILLANKTCKVCRYDKYLEIKSMYAGTVRFYTLSDGFVVDPKIGNKRTIKISGNQIELIEFDKVIETFIRKN